MCCTCILELEKMLSTYRATAKANNQIIGFKHKNKKSFFRLPEKQVKVNLKLINGLRTVFLQGFGQIFHYSNLSHTMLSQRICNPLMMCKVYQGF